MDLSSKNISHQSQFHVFAHLHNMEFILIPRTQPRHFSLCQTPQMRASQPCCFQLPQKPFIVTVTHRPTPKFPSITCSSLPHSLNSHLPRSIPTNFSRFNHPFFEEKFAQSTLATYSETFSKLVPNPHLSRKKRFDIEITEE